MAVGEQLNSEQAPDSSPVRTLASRVTSIFLVPSPLFVEKLFAPLAQATDRANPPFHEIGKVLRANIDGLLSAVSIPFTLASKSALNTHWQRIHSAERIRSLMLDAKPDETKQQLESRRERAANENAKTQMDNFVRSAEGVDAIGSVMLNFLDGLCADESLVEAAKELILQGLVLCWGAFEVFARDCFIAYLNANPSRTLVLLADPVAKRRFELSKFSVETLAAHNFNLAARMGTLLAQQQDLSDLYSVKAVYQALFPDDRNLCAALSDPDLRLLSLRRNLIVHQRGLIDDPYAAATACVQSVGERLKVAPGDLETHLHSTVKTAVGMFVAVTSLT